MVANKMTKYRWVVMLFIVIVCAIANSDRANIGFALPYIRKEFPMSNTEAGAVIGLFNLSYAIFQIPAGFLIGKFGVRNMFSIGLFLTSIFTGMMTLVNTAFQFKVMRLLLGLAEAPVVVGCTTTINNWFPPKEKGTATGIFLAGSKVGPLIVPPICAWIIMVWGWREIFIFFMVPGIICAVLWYLFVASKPEESKFVSEAELKYIEDPENTAIVKSETKKKREYKLWWLDKIIRAKNVDLLDSPAKVFRSWDIYGVAIAYAFIIGISYVLMAWLPTYLIEVKKFAVMKSAFVSAAPFAGIVLGNFIGGWISDNLLNKRRKPLMLVTALTTSVAMYSLVYSPGEIVLLAMLLFVVGLLLSLGYSAFPAYPMGRVTKEMYPVAFGIVSTGGQIGGAAAPLIVGMILDRFNWDMVFAVLAAGLLVCFLLVSTVVEPVNDPLKKPQ
jgi:sugar phosphate permease